MGLVFYTDVQACRLLNAKQYLFWARIACGLL